MSEWQSINSAPKDGTKVLVVGTRGNMLTPDHQLHVAYYSRGWWSGGDVLSHVTHWQPLPELP